MPQGNVYLSHESFTQTADKCLRIPEGVKDEEAGPIMCGGVTAYTACKRSAVRPGQWVVVIGAGGGKQIKGHNPYTQLRHPPKTPRRRHVKAM